MLIVWFVVFFVAWISTALILWKTNIVVDEEDEE